MASFLDLHAHYLPAIDDGAPDLRAALEMVTAAKDLGFSHLCATPHQRADMYLPSAEAISTALAALRGALATLDGAPRLDVAAENYWDAVLHDRLASRSQPCYPGGKAFLFEVAPGLMPPGLEAHLFRLRLGGQLPVLAHPERYRAIQEDLSRAELLGRTAALVVDLAALDGAHGRPQMKTARRLVEERIAHAAATDLHKPEDAAAVGRGMDWVRRRLGPAALDRLLAEHPRRILAGDLPD